MSTHPHTYSTHATHTAPNIHKQTFKNSRKRSRTAANVQEQPQTFKNGRKRHHTDTQTHTHVHSPSHTLSTLQLRISANVQERPQTSSHTQRPQTGDVFTSHSRRSHNARLPTAGPIRHSRESITRDSRESTSRELLSRQKTSRNVLLQKTYRQTPGGRDHDANGDIMFINGHERDPDERIRDLMREIEEHKQRERALADQIEHAKVHHQCNDSATTITTARGQTSRAETRGNTAEARENNGQNRQVSRQKAPFLCIFYMTASSTERHF
jgi:hypothetical protein